MTAPHALRFSSPAPDERMKCDEEVAFSQNAFDLLPLCLAFVQE
jgi:hypothetical protein